MAVLRRIPGGSELTLEPGVPLTYPDGSTPCFVIASYRRRWLLYDVSGSTRVGSHAVSGGATTLEDGDLISVREPAERLRFSKSGGEALRTVGASSVVCSYCREHFEDGEPCQRCSSCERLQHDACLETSGACGRCGLPMQLTMLSTMREEGR